RPARTATTTPYNARPMAKHTAQANSVRPVSRNTGTSCAPVARPATRVTARAANGTHSSANRAHAVLTAAIAATATMGATIRATYMTREPLSPRTTARVYLPV